jgi:hypothetical protein
VKDKDKKKSAGKGVKINFSGVETRSKIPDGQYHARVAEGSTEEGNQAPYIKWTFEIVEDGKFKGRKLWTNTSLAPQALWNLRNMLECLGVEVSEEDDLDVEKDIIKPSIDCELMVRVENEVYDGKDRPKITDYTAIDEAAEVEDEDGDEDEEEEEKPAKKASKKPAAAAKEDDEEEEETEDEEEEEEKADEDDDEDDEEEETDGKVTADEIREMDADELVDLVKKHKLKLDLTKIPKAGKRIAAVIDALETKGLLG